MYFVYSEEQASHNIASVLKDILGLSETERFNGLECFSNGKDRMVKVTGRLINAEFLDGIVDDTTIFLSRHSSGKGIPAFTVHAQGNWTDDNSFGGRPKTLSVSSPSNMFNILHSINRLNSFDMQVTYEATHHGPFLNVPSLFVELGGNESVINSVERANLVANAIAGSFENGVEYGKVAIGIGGMHYPSKFTRLALEGKYAFAHIMPKYKVGCTNMIGAAMERSDRKPEIALVEWKSIKAAERERIVRELNQQGIDYAKV